jgi:DNA-binding CsgD family transcriptional regulator
MAVESLGQYDAVHLFLDRAQRVRPNFHLDDVTGPVIADICQRLDGIPLAIELAASRCRSLRPQQIRDGLAESLDLLTGGARSGIGRQQTLAASMTWSHDLLTPTEQILFRRLASFREGCSLDDAEPVVSDVDLPSAAVLDLLDRLVAQSLLVAEDAGPVQRYRMLETVRQFAARKLDEAGERQDLEGRHAEHFVTKLEQVGPTFERAFDVEDLRWSVEEMDNLDRAIRTIGERGESDRASRACWHLALAWGLVDPPACERLLTHLLDLTVSDEGHAARLRRAELIVARAHLCMWSGDLLQSAIHATEGLALAEDLGESALALRARVFLGQVVVWVDPDEGIRIHRQALDDARSQGDQVAEVLALTGIGGAHAGIVSELSLGRQPLDEAVERAEALGNPLLQAWADSQQAVASAFAGDLDAAEAWASAGERRLQTVGSAIGARELRLTQGNVVGGVITFAQACARSQRADGSPWLLSLPDMAARAAAAGYLLTPSLLEISYAVTVAHHGDHTAAEQSLARCRASAERSGAEAALVNAAAYWCDLALAAGDVDEAKRRLASVEDRTLASRSMHARVRLGLRRAAVALIEGEVEAAEREAHDALSLCVREGIAWETFHALEILAQIALATGSPAEAARVAGAVGAIRARHDINVRLAWHAEQFDVAVIAARESLGDEAFERSYAEGSALSTADAAAYVQRARGERKRPSFGWDGLTPTEREVVRQVSEGRTNPQIAEAMFISRETVKTHLSHIFAKLNMTSRAELAAAAVRREATR